MARAPRPAGRTGEHEPDARLAGRGSFFLGQQLAMPAFMRGSSYLTVPELAVLGAMLFWLCRVWFTRPRWPASSALPTRRLPLAALCLAILGCTRELPLALPPDKPAQVSEFGGRPRTLEPASEDYRALQGWVSRNRAGWSWGRYYTAPPAKGILVRAGSLNLQFFESTVLAHTPDGDYVKQLPPGDHAFLERIARGD